MATGSQKIVYRLDVSNEIENLVDSEQLLLYHLMRISDIGSVINMYQVIIDSYYYRFIICYKKKTAIFIVEFKFIIFIILEDNPYARK